MAKKIDLYLFFELDIPTLAPVLLALRALGADAEFILEPPVAHPFYCNQGEFQRSAGDYLAIRAALRARSLSALDAPRPDADLVAATQGVDWVFGYICPKVRVMYGAGVLIPPGQTEVYCHREVNQNSSAILAHGEYSAQRLTKWCAPADIYKVGFPKHAAALRGELDRPALRRRFDLSDDRPVLVYLPTWTGGPTGMGTLTAFAAAVARLGERFQVFCKPHVHSPHFEADALAALRGAPGVRVIDDEQDIGVFFTVADLVMADICSGGFTEALMFNKPVIALLPPGQRPHVRLADGIETAAPLCDDPAALAGLVERMLRCDEHAAERRRWASFIFEDSRGHDDEVAARALLDIVRRKPTACKLLADIKIGGAPSDAPLISVLISGAAAASADLAAGLAALERQTLDARRFEVILDGAAAAPPSNTRQYAVHCLEAAASADPGDFWRRGLATARGMLILLLRADQAAAPALLENHLKSHLGLRRPGAAVAGETSLPADFTLTVLGHVFQHGRMWLAHRNRLHRRRVHPPGFVNVFCEDGFFTGNISFNAAALRQAGVLHDAFNAPNAAGVELGLRLERAQWQGIMYEPECRVTAVRYWDVAEFCRMCHADGVAFRTLAAQYPDALRVKRQMSLILGITRLPPERLAQARDWLAHLADFAQNPGLRARPAMNDEDFYMAVGELSQRLYFAGDWYFTLGFSACG